MKKLHPRAVIFDLGSTLIEYEAIPWSEINVHCDRSACEFLHREGHPVPDDEEFHRVYGSIKDRYREHAIKTLKEWTVVEAAAEMLRQWDIAPDPELLDRFFDAYYRPMGEMICPYDDTVATLKNIRRRYPVIGLVSNTVFPERAHRQELKRFGIEPYLDFAVFSSTFGLRKPHADIFYQAANLAGCAPAECVYIGDRYIEDVQGPTGIGMAAILKLWNGREYPDDIPDTTRTITTLSELNRHIELEDANG